MSRPTMWQIRRVPGARSRDRHARRVAVIEAPTQREALEAFAAAEGTRAGWSLVSLEWSGTGGLWHDDDGATHPRSDWRVFLTRQNGAQTQRATYLAWRGRP